MSFLDENYLLDSREAADLYAQIRDLPILDPHNHADVEEIVENEGWEDIWEVEAETDHYVWELMRRRGVPEEKITGDAPNREKWQALCEIFPDLIGNPTYEWIHLDLRRRFGIDLLINEHTADVIWEKTAAQLATEEMTPQRLLKEMNVKIMCSTDDPVSRLEFHRQAAEEIEGIEILPTWRPDRAMKITAGDWKEYVVELGEATGTDTSSFFGFLEALEKSHSYFDDMGCVASDHGLFEPVSRAVPKTRVQDIFDRGQGDEQLSEQEASDFRAYMLEFFGELNEAKGWVTQIHIGAVRDYRDKLFTSLGPDSGGDVASNFIEVTENLRHFLNRFDESMTIVLYCLDPVHLPSLTTLARAFPNVQLGAPWWFNDSAFGMEEQLKYVATVDLLANHAGMVSDSRKLMSYDSRTEVFRRVLCSVLAELVNKGQAPYGLAADMAVRLAYRRPLELFFE